MTTKRSDGGPAFPCDTALFDLETGEYTGKIFHPGMSLRDWFAGKALQGLLAHGETLTDDTETLAYADDMLKEREK